MRATDKEPNLKKINDFLKEVYYYEYCNKAENEECEHIHCMYSIVHIGSECSKITCDRIRH